MKEQHNLEFFKLIVTAAGRYIDFDKINGSNLFSRLYDKFPSKLLVFDSILKYSSKYGYTYFNYERLIDELNIKRLSLNRELNYLEELELITRVTVNVKHRKVTRIYPRKLNKLEFDLVKKQMKKLGSALPPELFKESKNKIDFNHYLKSVEHKDLILELYSTYKENEIIKYLQSWKKLVTNSDVHNRQLRSSKTWDKRFVKFIQTCKKNEK